GRRAPKGWSDAPEFDGGTVAFFRIDWRYAPGEPFHPVATQETPREHTGFDWRRWIGRPEQSAKPVGKARLVDRE
ncbi:MAG: hypothetical protein ACYSU0_15520, partial [Planctomycetota bacterium]